MDDGYVTGPAANMMKAFSHLKSTTVLKLSPFISVGNSFGHVGSLSVIDDDGMWVRELDMSHESCAVDDAYERSQTANETKTRETV